MSVSVVLFTSDLRVHDHPPLRVDRDRKTLASCHQPHLDFLASTDGHKRVSMAVTFLQIALQEANAQRREEIVLLPRSRCLPTTLDRHTPTPTVLRDEWIIPNNTVVGVWTAIEKAVSPDGLG